LILLSLILLLSLIFSHTVLLLIHSFSFSSISPDVELRAIIRVHVKQYIEACP
jgi:hypothetical protein